MLSRVCQGESISHFLFSSFLNDFGDALSVGQFQEIKIDDIITKTPLQSYTLFFTFIRNKTREDLQVGLIFSGREGV